MIPQYPPTLLHLTKNDEEPGCAGEQVCHIQLRSVAWIPHDPGHLKTSGHEERVRLRTASMGMEALHPSVPHGSALCAIPGKVLITRSRPIRVNVSLVCHTPPPWRNRPTSSRLSSSGFWVSSNRARQSIAPSRALIS